MAAATMVRQPAGSVAGDAAAFALLAADLAPGLLAGRDDVEAAAGCIPRAEDRQDWHWSTAGLTPDTRRWYGKIAHPIKGGHALSGLDVVDGLTFTLTASLGGIRLSTQGLARKAAREAQEDAPPLALIRLRSDLSDVGRRAGVIAEWSPRSRARMVETLAGLDYSPMAEPGTTPGMVTLTYPGRWWECAPTGRDAKVHLEKFRRRFTRAYGFWRGLWKMEFQRRGAPHFHLYLPVPALAPCCHRAGRPCGAGDCPGSFTTWLSRTWADVVQAPDVDEYARHLLAGTGVDFAARMTDHRRIGVYFLKHGTKTADDKEYQHVVPARWQGDGDGPGRFWGYWGLSRTDVAVPVDAREFIVARRLLRRAYRARARSTAYRRAYRQGEKLGMTGAQLVRHAASAPYRTARTLGAGGRLAGGFLLVNDGVRLVQQVGYWLSVTKPARAPGSPA